ncbi:MAG: ATP-binding protein [Wujia sp.]
MSTKKKRKILPSINIFFTVLVLLEFVVTILLATLVQWILESLLNVTISTPEFILLSGIIMGGALAFLINRIFFQPIQKLSREMKKVAKGDFTVKLTDKSKINELQEIYDSFELMVKELGATEILQTDFIANVSHEIKTPINAIEGYAMLLQDCQYTPDEQEEYINKILFNTKRLSELVGNVLLLSRIDNQAIQKKENTFRLDEQVRQSIMQLEAAWTDKDIEFDVEMDKIEFIGNAPLLIHVWNNLIGNAIKFSPVEGIIKIRLNEVSGVITFIIEDIGPGIDEKAIKHIFDKFYQGDSSHKVEGNGLGLALVKKIVDIYSGTIEVCNLPEGGCRFTACLPSKAEGENVSG